MKNNTGRLFLGIAVILLGLVFLLEQIGLSDILGGRSLIGFFWPILIIATGIVFLVKGGTTPGLVLTTLGVLFFVSHIFGWSIWSNWWPLILIVIGVAILVGKTTENTLPNSISGTTSASSLNDFLAFWGAEKHITSKEFSGGRVTCLFGGEKIDLCDAGISKEGGKLEVFCAFGGVEIIVPTEMNVEVSGNGFLGAIENKSTASTEASARPKLLIVGNVAFGGIEVKN